MRKSILGQLRRLAAETGLDPAEVAGMVVEAIRERRFFVLTHPDEAFAAMEQRIQWMRTGVPPAERKPGRAAAAPVAGGTA